ncbi:hypothetical protein LTR85_006398 [Meristemomyces frigidus]|nr:hypothetical protein LTR85_006398 [Meristemomyces frigidus]
MGRIKKVATERHTATLSPAVSEFVSQATSIPLHRLPGKLADFPQHWPFPRGDLYHWIQLLDRFDHVLELFNKEYELKYGPQTQPFERRLLQKGDAEEGMPYPSHGAQSEELDTIGYSEEGDRELVEAIVHFTRILLEHCGNRSLYASSGYINDLLNTTSLSLLRLCLKLALRLSQRYQVARYKNSNPHAQAVLMANHYNFNLDNLHKLAMPFPRFAVSPVGPAVVTLGKGKEKAGQAQAFNPSDLIAIAKEPQTLAAKGDMASVSISYYDQAAQPQKAESVHQPSEASPATPTPARRTSNLGPSRDRPPAGDRSTSATDASALTPAKSRDLDASASTAPKFFQISPPKVAETPAWALLREALPSVPTEVHYDLLNRIRIAKALASPETSSQQLLEVRLLAIANLAYALGESKFQERVGIPDSEEPRRYHLAQQLCDLLQPATNGQRALTLEAETTVLMALESLLKSRHKSSEVVDALSITVNHGVLYYELRKVIASLNVEEHADKQLELREMEWREATFDLVNSLQLHNAQVRSGERLVQAGIIGILVEVLSLRTSRAERFHEKVLQFFASFIHNIEAAFQAFANNKGFDLIADLAQYEVETALRNAKSGNGLQPQFKSKVVDYDIPYFQQSTLRQLFKFTVHLFEHNAGANDRLLRNLIDTPQMLGALKTVISNAKVFGSNVWGGAVNIMSSFIHSEPTSYSVVGEAGLPKAFLEAVIGEAIPDVPPGAEEPSFDPSSVDVPDKIEMHDGEPQYPTVNILPVGETMCDIPAIFGAICLNDSHGMKLFQSSQAMMKYFDIFLSEEHVKALEDDPANIATAIGQGFDELARHHPRLKEQVVVAVASMVKRVASLCRNLAEHKNIGAKLWKKNTESGKWEIDGGNAAMRGTSASVFDDARESGALITPTAKTVQVTADDVAQTASEKASALRFLTACAKFLEGFFHNSGMCAYFCEKNGAEYVLDLVTAPSNPYDLPAFGAYNKLSQVVRTMCEAKSHLVLPSLVRRLQNALMAVRPITESSRPEGLFAPYVDPTQQPGSPLPVGLDGTTVLKSLAHVHALSDMLGKTLAPPSYTSRHSSQTNQLFANLNFTDVYIQLVDDLSRLHAACLWESLALQKIVPAELKDRADPRPYIMRRVGANGYIELASESRLSESLANGANGSSRRPDSLISADEDFVVKNVQALRYEFDQTPKGIETFFHTLGQALVPKRSNEVATKQHASLVADHLAKAYLWELDYRKLGEVDETTELKYIATSLQATCKLMLKTSFSMDGYGPKEALTLVLSKFYLHGGFKRLNEYLHRFGELIGSKPAHDDPRLASARDGLYSILDLYGHVARSKTIMDANQSAIISVRDHRQADFFMPGQFVVEIREAVLPAVSKLWYSDAIETIGDSYVKKVIEILRVILKGEGEDRALKRIDKASRRVHTSSPDFSLRNTNGVSNLQTLGFERTVARESIYRCNNLESTAREYASLRRDYSAPRFAIPEGESSAQSTAEAGRPTSSARSVEMAEDPDTPPPLVDPEVPSSDLMSDDDVGALGGLPADIGEQDLMAMIGSGRLQDILSLTNGGGPAGGPSAAPPAQDTRQPFTTIEDLEDKRKALRDALIDRCLEVLSAVPAVTFELSDLIQAAVAKSGDSANPRADIGGTLVSSLMSLQGSEPTAEAGVKISAYAHLVALILQDRDFFDSTLDELKEYFDALVAWVQLGSDQKAEDAPWMEMILLIIERVLAEDEQPAAVTWDPLPSDDPLKALPEPILPEPTVSTELRTTLFDALIDVLPKVGRNESLALSVSRVLVTLTRKREFAVRLSEKQSMHRLFMMIRQLAGSVNDKLQSCFLLILRHMIEDEQIIRQIMQTEIRAALEGHRSSRAMDTTTYTRNLYHLVLRDPHLFVEVTKEMVEITRFDGHPNRAQSLALKKDKPATPKPTEDAETAAKPSVEAGEGESDAQKPAEAKPPLVESTDGVIAFLLRELSTYKDVEEKPPLPSKESQPAVDSDSNGDVDMTDDSVTPTPAATPTPNGTPPSTETAKVDKPVFKPEEHPIYVYRCFILQCLSELLLSYNRTKVEFINFSRKPETQPATPVKPRAGTLNYLLNVLIPVGTLEHKDDISHRKKLSTSNWATTVIVSLCSKTTERGMRHQRALDLSPEEDADLTFVRKFVLEHALRSFKEATTSTEPLDQRYSRLLALGELFNRMLSKTERSLVADSGHTRQIGRMMYEKNYIAALTAAIAELDLNFPNAKRAVKYILGPLRLLTDLGVSLSATSDLSSSAPGTSTEEEEDISSATSVSDADEDEREQTPDLLRNTTLGMLESSAGQDEESESDDDDDDEDDDDMYDDGYEEEMDYEEEAIPEHGDVVSDEDEDDGMGDVEGMPGDVDMDVEVIMNDDEDDEDEDEDDDGDEDDDDDGDEDQEFADHMDEITGDDENASMGEDGEEAWEEDDGDADEDGSPHGGPLDHLARVVGLDDRSEMGEQGALIRVDMGAGEEEFFEDEMPPEDEDEEDEEVDYENDVVYEPELEGLLGDLRYILHRMQINDPAEDEEDDEMGGWDFDAPPAPGIIRAPHHHHHHHHAGAPRDFGEMFGMLGGNDTFRPAPTFRSHRAPSTGRGEDDGTNPLLQREGVSAVRDRADPLDIRFGRRTLGFPRTELIQDLVATVGAGGNGTINVRLGDMEAGMGMARGMPPMFQLQGRHGGSALIDVDPSRPIRDQLAPRSGDWRLSNSRSSADNAAEALAVHFNLTPTITRWQEEARMLFGGKHHEKATRVINALARLLVPPAMQAKLEHDKAERERRETEEKAREEERKKLEAEKAEREAREKAEREEREAREREEAARREQEQREAAEAEGAAMEGVEQPKTGAPVEEQAAAAPAAAAHAAAPAAPAERVTTTIRGREVDITSLAIDRDFLEAIPEAMREEVIMQQLQDQRAQATQAGEQPTEISREFLDALPREIQAELLRQERDDRRRRDRAEAQRDAVQDPNAQAAAPEDMNNADFMAMLDPGLRQAVLMDADENTLALLPEDLQAEARALLGDRLPRAGGPAAAARAGVPPRGGPGQPANGNRALQHAREAMRQQRRPVVQMLDKPGVATLLRLMFVSLHHKAKTNLHNILSDVCKNTHNRAEVISILLSILQDGTADVSAVERSFAQLSLRAKQASGPKTPQPLKRTPTGLAAAPSTELSPLNIVQHCLTTLNALSLDNGKVPSFFLTEHETATSQKAKTPKKGKGRESKAAKYPLNALLALLDRKLITDNTGVMETLAALLSRVTHPLTMLLRRAKEAQEDEKAPNAEAEVTSNEQDRPQSAPSDVPMAEAPPAEPTAEASAEPSTSEPPKPEEGDKAETKAEDKKHNELTPPEVPDENIRLVVNILAARECPSKTFSDTLDIIKNLSAIPGAKEVFGRELVRQAQELGQTVVVDLDDLAKQIDSAQTGTDLQGLALANFSSAGSKQRKLLRVILALDHLFDPKRMPPSPSSAEVDPKLKGDVLALLYDSNTFEQLWANLTTCLAAIRRRGNMVNVATILLPLIESLMVVCRNSTLNEAPTSTTVASPIDTSASTPPPDARMEGLFFRFTEDNRKILNELIRNNPKLMSGNLSILAKNSKVLEFDNKRTYFTRKLRNRGEVRVAHPSLQLSVRRDNVFLDSFKSLYYKSPDEIKFGKLHIRFHGEEGVDAGGVSREWFAAMARQMFNPDYALFNPVASDRTTFHPNPLSEVNPEHLLFFKFIGRIIGKALYEGRVLDCHFSRAVYRRILGKTVSLKDMESLDLEYYKSLVWILENDITEVAFESFCVTVDRFGAEEVVDLIPNGRNIPVTEENKQEYVQLVVEHRLIKSVESQLDSFLEGFHEIIPQELVAIFNEQELELLISGLPDIDPDDWKNNTEYHNYQATSPQIQWFWRAVRSFDKEEKAKLLQFVTGTSKVPLNGFKELEGMNGFARFNIHRDYSSNQKLPSSHTCFNQLDLPEYESYEHLRQQMYTAITAGSEYFGFA